MQKLTGVLKRKRNGGILLDAARSFRRDGEEVFVPEHLLKRFDLPEGAVLTGVVRNQKRKIEMATIETVCGLKPDEFLQRVPYTRLTAIDPIERFNFANSSDPTLRVIDLIAPLGKGSRAMIVSPPKVGKTMILEKLAQAMCENHPECRVIVLLVDERPEEVTQFQRATQAEVISSTNDQESSRHVEICELVGAHVRAELECGRDIVVLVDSLTRMGRAFNVEGGGSAGELGGGYQKDYARGNHRRTGRGRTMSGGLEVGSLEIPRRFFGMARNIENGGSVTIVATALVDTGSRMDEVIFEEFKGTGNCEIVLDRTIAESRVFPAINVASSGTRREERLRDPEELRKVNMVRRALLDYAPKEAMEALLKRLDKFETNEEFLDSIGK